MIDTEFKAWVRRLAKNFPAMTGKASNDVCDALWDALPSNTTAAELDEITRTVLESGAEFFPTVPQILGYFRSIRREQPQITHGLVYRGDDISDIAIDHPRLADLVLETDRDRRTKIKVGPVRDRKSGDTGPPSRTRAETLILHRWAEAQELLAQFRAGKKVNVPLFFRPESDHEWFERLERFFPELKAEILKHPIGSPARAECWRMAEVMRLGLQPTDSPWPTPRTDRGREVSRRVALRGQRALAERAQDLLGRETA